MTPKRAPRRTGERGAAIFIVLMITTLLTAIGVFAVRTSSLVERAVGFARKGSQAFYVGEFGSTQAQAEYEGLKNGQTKTDPCAALAAIRAALPNEVHTCQSINETWGANQLSAILPISPLVAGDPVALVGTLQRPSTLGLTRVIPEYKLEISEHGPGGSSQGNSTTRMATFTVYSRVRPEGAACSADTAQATGQVRFRIYASSTDPTGS